MLSLPGFETLDVFLKLSVLQLTFSPLQSPAISPGVSVRVELHKHIVRRGHNVLRSFPTAGLNGDGRFTVAVVYLNIVILCFSAEVCEAHFDGFSLSNPDFLGGVMGVGIKTWVIGRRQNPKL